VTFAADFKIRLDLIAFQHGSVTVNGNWSGTLNDTQPGHLETVTIVNGSMTPTGVLQVGSLDTMTIGPANLSVGQDMAGQIMVSGTLSSLRVAGGTPGSITAGHIGTVSVYGGFGPVVLQITENDIQRRVEEATSTNPYPLPNPNVTAATSPYATLSPATPKYINIQYFYESGTLANPQWTARITNNASAVADQFDLSLVTYSDKAKFNLARLDATGVSGVRNVDVEGDVLTSVSNQASSFFPGDNTAAGIRLPLDKLAGVGVRDTLPTGFVQAKSIQALAFGSYTYVSAGKKVTASGASAGASAAAGLLAPGTAIIQANDTFRVPFADLTSVGLYLATAVGGGKFDTSNVVFVVESMLSPNATGTANIVTYSNVARGAVTALVNVVVPIVNGILGTSVIQTISLRGDGGSLSTSQYIAQGITSTGPLGDVTQHSSLGITNVTAASIFGSIIDAWGPITGTLQTTGQRLDPITAQMTAATADWGEVYVTVVNKVPTLTVTTVQTSGAGLGGRLISRGNLISQVLATGGVKGLVAAQGNIGIVVGSHRLGGISFSGKFTGAVVTLGSIIGNLSISGGMVGTRIAAKGDIIGNVSVSGGMDASSVIVSGGEIGDATWGTQFTFGGTNNGIIAAKGPIRFAKGSPGGNVFTNDTADAAVIDAVFSKGISPLSSTDIFDQTTPGDLLNLNQLLLNLSKLTVTGGNLSL
jgi:hypothetical protein